MFKKNPLASLFTSSNSLSTSSLFGEVRSEGEEGVFSGYIVKWNQIDSYRTKFAKGAFAKTIKNDFGKMKVFYEHEQLIGSPIEMREDDTGVFVRGQINLNTSIGSDTWQFLKTGEVNGLSFRFRSTKPDTFENGIRVIQEVQVREFGPVVFPAGDESLVTDLRAATFSQILDAAQLRQERYQLTGSLMDTLDGIHWENSANATDQVDSAIEEFRGKYLDWCSRFYMAPDASRNEILAVNEMAASVVKDMQSRSNEDYAAATGLTVQEVETLLAGNLISDRTKLDNLAPEIRSNHQKLRTKLIEDLCWELRSGNLTNFELMRLNALIDKPAPVDYTEVFGALQNIQTTCK